MTKKDAMCSLDKIGAMTVLITWFERENVQGWKCIYLALHILGKHALCGSYRCPPHPYVIPFRNHLGGSFVQVIGDCDNFLL